jgi:hypothetical protein
MLLVVVGVVAVAIKHLKTKPKKLQVRACMRGRASERVCECLERLLA